MLPDIYILTMGRPTKQLTYETLPDFLKSKVTFVVRGFEASHFQQAYPKNAIAVCPNWVVNVATTRKFIQQLAGDTYHWVMDDDLKRLKLREYNSAGSPTWRTKPATDEVWRMLCAETADLIQQGFGFITFASASVFPNSSRYPYKEGLAGFQWFAMNGQQCRQIQWDDINLADDWDGIMQAISHGVRIARFERWVSTWGPQGAPGGCANERNVQTHNDAIFKLIEKWTPFIKVKQTTNTMGYKNDKMLKTVCYLTKAYKHYQSARTLSSKPSPKL